MEEPRIEIINKEEFQAKIDLITEAFSKKPRPTALVRPLADGSRN